MNRSTSGLPKAWRVSLTSDTVNLASVRETISQAATDMGFAEPVVSQIVLAVDEAIANVIRHGYEGCPGKPIDVTIESVRHSGVPALQVTVCDCGRQVDPDRILGRALEDVRPGGLGTHIIRSVMDEVEYTVREPAGMILRMVKCSDPQARGLQMAAQADCVRQVRHSGASIVVSLQGAIDLHRAPEVHKALIAACDERPERLIINLEAVRYMDSSGIGTLVEVFRRIHAYNGKLALCGLNERVHSLFEITRLDKFFRIVPTESEALAE